LKKGPGWNQAQPDKKGKEGERGPVPFAGGEGGPLQKGLHQEAGKGTKLTSPNVRKKKVLVGKKKRRFSKHLGPKSRGEETHWQQEGWRSEKKLLSWLGKKKFLGKVHFYLQSGSKAVSGSLTG